MNMQSIMAQAQRMQRDIQKKKDEINQKLFPGKYEFVEVILKITINKDNLDKEDIEMLEDFIVLAQKQALADIDKEFQSKMGQYAGMLDGLM